MCLELVEVMSGKRQVPEGDITVRTAVAVVSVKEVDEGHLPDSMIFFVRTLSVVVLFRLLKVL